MYKDCGVKANKVDMVANSASYNITTSALNTNPLDMSYLGMTQMNLMQTQPHIN